MTPIINAREISKRFGSLPLFENLSLNINDDSRMGLIGPNGSGKSTLMQILCGRLDPDGGVVAVRKRARMNYVAQISEFAPGETVRSVIDRALKGNVGQSDEAASGKGGGQAKSGTGGDAVGEIESDAARERRYLADEALARAGFRDFDATTETLSGGWRKRLAIAEALVQRPDVLLLDEPTNHLDLAGIRWLEAFLRDAPFAFVVVSHDRYFLENVASEVVELDRAYAEGLLRVPGTYSKFLEGKQAYLHAQKQRQEALGNRVRNEIEWLRRGPKARTTKSKARIGNANELIGELADLNSRSRTATTKIDFTATDRKTKDLVKLERVSYTIGEKQLFDKLDFTVKSQMRVGLVGPNGSGKTTLLRLMAGAPDVPGGPGGIEPTSGTIKRADALRIVYFDQNRSLDPNVILRRALAPEGDSVTYQDRVIHVAAWAARFLFSGEDLQQPVGRLSGGERARVLIAQLMLQSADVLLLDEPTNDLDIPTLEILEESLLEFSGALALVTHDRYLLDRVSTTVLGLDGFGHAERFADYGQWEVWQDEQERSARGGAAAKNTSRDSMRDTPAPSAAGAASSSASSSGSSGKKLSYMDAREFAVVEQRIAESEQALQAKRTALEDPAVQSDAERLHKLCTEVEAAEQSLDALYTRWAELEEKKT